MDPMENRFFVNHEASESNFVSWHRQAPARESATGRPAPVPRRENPGAATWPRTGHTMRIGLQVLLALLCIAFSTPVLPQAKSLEYSITLTTRRPRRAIKTGPQCGQEIRPRSHRSRRAAGGKPEIQDRDMARWMDRMFPL